VLFKKFLSLGTRIFQLLGEGLKNLFYSPMMHDYIIKFFGLWKFFEGPSNTFSESRKGWILMLKHKILKN
jgi:hypothetical protein